MVFEEIAVNHFLQSFATPMLTEVFKLITDFGNPAFWFIIAAWFFWIGKERKSFVIMSLILFVGVIAGGLKLIIARPRPDAAIALITESGYSMPSGHASIIGAYTSYALLSDWLNKNIKYLMILLAIGVVLSRMYLGVHYLSDVLVGLLLGGIIGWIMIKLDSRLNKMKFHISKIEEEFLVIAFFVAMVILYFFVPEQYAAAWAVLGYFIGYAIFRHSGIDLNIERTKTKTQALIAIFVGTIILGAMGFYANKRMDMIGNTIFLFSGIFITIIWPIVMTIAVEKREKHKAKKTLKKKAKRR